MKKTVVIGASENPERYAYRATRALENKGFEAVPVGLKKGKIFDTPILDGKPAIENVDTVTLYVGPKNQPFWYDYILSLKPKRVIFNPGTENPELEEMLVSNKIEPVIACTLVMLAVGDY